MPKFPITLDIEVRDDREAAQVQQSLDHLVNLNGALGLLNLYHELTHNVVARTLVTAIAKRTPRK